MSALIDILDFLRLNRPVFGGNLPEFVEKGFLELKKGLQTLSAEALDLRTLEYVFEGFEAGAGGD